MEQVQKCANGVPIYSFLNEHLHSVRVSLYFRAGVLYEQNQINGISHFYEHIVFRNIKKLMGGTLYQVLDRHAIDFNASTYKEFVCFDLFFSPSVFEIACDIMEKIFAPLCLSAKEVDLERSVIRCECNEDDGKDSTGTVAQREVWTPTTLALPILGTYSTINRISRVKLKQFAQTLFCPENFFVYVTGDATPTMLQTIAAVIARQDLPVCSDLRCNVAPIPEHFLNRNCKIRICQRDYCDAQLCFDYECHPNTRIVRNVLYDLLFLGECGAFYQELTDQKGLLYSVDAVQEEYANIGNFSFNFDFEQPKLTEILQTIVEILRGIKQGNFTLDYCRMQQIRKMETMLDDVSELNWHMAFEQYLLAPQEKVHHNLEAYLAVTPQQVSEAARDIFTTDHLVAVFAGKRRDLKAEKIKGILCGLDA